MPDEDAALWEHFCAIKPVRNSCHRILRLHPLSLFWVKQHAKTTALSHRNYTLDNRRRYRLRQRTDGSVCQGRQPLERQLTSVTPAAPYDLELSAELRLARRVQWWYSYTHGLCKVVNVTNTLKTMQRGTIVANVYAMNASDVERIQLLAEPPLADPDPDVIGDERADTSPKRVDLSEAIIGQVSPIITARIIALLAEYRD